jgi:SAM-dependent methyltransferase
LLGDLETFDFGGRKFDVVICWNVLEHLSNLRAAMARLTATLTPGGLLIIAGPVVSSMKGLLTKFTPHWVHVWFHRNVLGRRHAGKPGRAPFPAYLSFDVDLRNLVSALESKQQEIVYISEAPTYHATRLRDKYPVLHAAYAFASVVLRLLTGGRFGSLASDFILVARNAVSQAHKLKSATAPPALRTANEANQRRTG